MQASMETMTLPINGKKLSQNEIDSIEIAVKDSGIRAIHPEKLEAFADLMVQNLKGGNGYSQDE